MSKRQFLSLVGVWIMIFLFLGLPVLWHKILAIISGLVIIFMAYRLEPTKKDDERKPETFVDNNQA